MRPSPSRSLAWLLAAAAVVASPSAFGADPAAAQALFTDARQRMQAGDYAHACPLLEESERIDAAVGTLYHLADCDEHLGKTATAWALFLEVADKTHAAGQPAREQAARDRAAALSGRLSRVVVVVPGERWNGLVIQRDGTPVSSTQLGVALPVDPGPHAFSATAPGRQGWRKTVDVPADGATITVTVPGLAREDASASADPRDAAFDPPEKPAPEGAGDTASKPLSTRRTVAAALVGAGALGVAVGTTFGLVSWAKHGESNSGCDQANVCSATAGAARNDAISTGNVSTAAFAIGLSVAAVGVVLWLTEPTAPQAATAASPPVALGIAPSPAGAVLVGTFR